MKGLIVVILLVIASEANAQNNVIGVKLYSLHPRVLSTRDSPNDQELNYRRSSLSSTSMAFYERYLSKKGFLLGMIYYDQHNSVVSKRLQFNAGVIGLDTVRRNSKFLRVDIGGGRLLSTHKDLSLKINATAFYQFTVIQRSVNEINFLDSNGYFLGRTYEEVQMPNINQVGVSITPQLCYRVWNNLSLVLDIRVDFFYQITKGLEREIAVEKDEYLKPISRIETQSYEYESVLYVLEHYGLGLSYKF